MVGSKNNDIRNIDRSKLRNLEQVRIDVSLPCEQRVANYVEQIGDPYCYLDGDVVVSLGFTNPGIGLQDRLKALALNIS